MTDDREIHAARFGDRNGAHDALQDTGPPRALLNSIKWFTDRPGTRWEEAASCTYSGYSSEEHYVVQATVSDSQAARSGMVRTTTLLIPHPYLPKTDLGLALDIIDALVETEPLRPVDAMSLKYEGRCTHAPGVETLADTLAATGVAVWIGPGHREALSCLWRHLSDDDRHRLQFAATDHPDVVALPRSDDSLRVLVVPDPLPAPFADTPTVDSESSKTADGPSAALLAPEGHPASLLASRLGLTTPTLREWQHLMTAERELRGIDNNSPDPALAVIALLGLLAPAPQAGADLKKEILERLHSLLLGRPYAAVRSLRTVPWNALPEPERRVTMTAAWVHQAAADQDADSLADALQELENHDATWFPELHLKITEAVAADWRLTAKIVAKLFLNAQGRTAFGTTLRHAHLDSLTDFDLALSDSLCGMLIPGVVASGWAADEALHHGWATTHATVIGTGDPIVAWRTHLTIATNASVAILADRIAPTANVAVALELGHPLLAEQAGRLVVADPTLLSPPRPADPAYRQIWTEAIRHGMVPSACCSPASAAPALLDALLRGEQVDDALLEMIYDNADLILAMHSARAKLWTIPQTPAVARLRAATAGYLARRLTVGDLPLERPFAEEMLAASVLTSLAREHPAQAVTVLEVLDEAARDGHGEIVMESATRMTPEAAHRLGTLVRARRWRETAKRLVTSGRADLQPAVSLAIEILGFFERMFLWRQTSGGTIPEPSIDEARAASLDVLCEVYPEGPPLELWERAGGSAADRPVPQTGRQTWQAALRAIDVGAAGAPSMVRLLEEAHREHPRNDRLSMLCEHARTRR